MQQLTFNHYLFQFLFIFLLGISIFLGLALTLMTEPSIYLIQMIAHKQYHTTLDWQTISSITKQSYALAVNNTYTFESTLLTSAEVSHLNDVFIVITKAKLAFLVALSLTICLFLSGKRYFSRTVFTWLLFLLYSFFICLVSLGMQFSHSFIVFHQLLFPKGNWSFPENSALIQTFPPPFWFLLFSTYVSLLFFSITGLLVLKSKLQKCKSSRVSI